MITVSVFDPIREGLTWVEAKLQEAGPNEGRALRLARERLLNSGGKRLRPALVMLSGGMLGADVEPTVALAAAVEMLHTATLVHDDLIDGASLRRGTPTLNAKWSTVAAVLAGDYLFARAAALAAETGSVRLMSEFASTLMTMVSGELHQQLKDAGRPNRDDYFERIYAKTASLFELATGAAALISDADQATVAEMARFGREVGTAFQIVDDVLDIAGDPDRVGKPLGSDLRQGLATLPTLYYLERYPDDADVTSLLNGHAGDAERVSRAVAAIRNSGAINDALAEAGTFIERAREILQGMPDVQERHALAALADYFMQREL